VREVGDGVSARPFVKWAGGKTQLLPELVARMPTKYGTYIEPFVGGGALFFAVRPTYAVLSDANKDLMNCYRALRASSQQVIELLSKMRFDKGFYYGKRALVTVDPFESAARFIYLNKTCFNGLYRVNSKGEFNVPIGKFKSPPTICDEENLTAVGFALRGVTIFTGDFEAAVSSATSGHFVYFDPPYVPLGGSSDFVNYTKGGFGEKDHVRLRDCALKLAREGVHVMLSNSDTPLVKRLYGNHFDLHRVEARRNINSKGGSRGAIGEYIITSY
jgi:DNA adenine methylase